MTSVLDEWNMNREHWWNARQEKASAFTKIPVSLKICQPKIQLGLTGGQTKATTGNLDLIVHVYLLYCSADLAVL